jgi:hypothetical protein
MLRQPGEYLWSPSKKQCGDERADRGWMEISPGVYVPYPTHWLRTLTPSDYVTVTLLNGSQVRYCRDAMERAVMDTASGGCHVRMTTNGTSLGVKFGE